jgi:hypothetical protein
MNRALPRWVACMTLAFAIPLAVTAQGTAPVTGGPYNPADVVSPAFALGAGTMHIVANLGTVGQHKMYYFYSTPAGTKPTGMSKLEMIGEKSSAVGVTYASDGLHVFSITPKGQLVHRWRGLDNKWSPWLGVALGFHGRPAAATYQGKVYAFASSNDANVMKYVVGLGGKFSAPVAVPGIASNASPSAAADANRLYVTGIHPTSSSAMVAILTGTAWRDMAPVKVESAFSPLGSFLVTAGTELKLVDYAAYLGGGQVGHSSTWPVGPLGAQETVPSPIVGYPALGRTQVGVLAMIAMKADGGLYEIHLTDYWLNWTKLPLVF